MPMTRPSRSPLLARLCALAGVLAGALLTGLPALAQGTGAAGLPADNSTIEIAVGTGSVLRLDSPVSAVFVADPAVADLQAQSSTILYIYGKRTGRTTIVAVDEGQEIAFEREVVVSHDLERIRNAIRQSVPSSSIDLRSIDGGIVMFGDAADPQSAEDVRLLVSSFLGENESIVNRVAIHSPTQVSLSVRVAEVSRQATEVLGVNWSAVLSPGDFLFGIATGREFVDPFGQTARLANGTGVASAVTGGYTSSDVNVNAILDALARDGLVTVLAEPTLTALSGETASFLAGGEFPVPVGRDDGDITIEFKQFGISLAFTPTVLNPDRISLRVRPEVSDLSDRGAIVVQGLTIPAISTRRAETTVELGSGQSFAIGGLLSTTTSNTIEKFPGLGDLPVLGPLFRSTSFQKAESELVIIVTPYLVTPTSPDRLQTPLDGFVEANTVDRIFNQSFAEPGVRGPARIGPSSSRLRGSAGFILE